MMLKIYKKGQGTYTRMTSTIVCMVLAAFGCWRLYQQLVAIDIANAATKVWVQSLVPVVLFAILALIVHLILNSKTITNFMINAEGEIKKVSWSTKQEIVVSTYIVISVVIFMAVFLGATDVIFQLFFRGIGLLPS